MWPLDRLASLTKPGQLIHVAAHEVRLLIRLGAQWRQTHSVPIHEGEHARLSGLMEALSQLFVAVPLKDRPRTTLLLDSRWVPVTCLHTGKAPLRGPAVERLAALRFTETHGPDWSASAITTTYRPGDVTAIAFALPAEISGWVQQHRRDLVSVTSTLLWCHATYWRSAKLARHQAWSGALLESDRTLLLTFMGTDLVGMHPGLAPGLSSTQLDAAVQHERRRSALLGVSDLADDLASPGQALSLHAWTGWPAISQQVGAWRWCSPCEHGGAA